MSIQIIDRKIKLYLNRGTPGVATVDGAQEFTNKTIALGDNTVTGTKAQFNTALTDGDFAFVGDVQPISANLTSWSSVAPSSKVDATGGTASGLTLNDGYTEEVFTVTGTTPALSPTNGTYQTWTLTANSTPTAGTWANGQSLTLHIDDGTAFTVTWTSLAVTWKTNGGVAPTLQTTGVTVIQLWKTGGVIYGARVGDS